MIAPRAIRLARLASTIYCAFSRVAHALPTTPENVSSFAATASTTLSHHPSDKSPASEQAFWFHVSLSAALVLLGGVFAGLTIGLMGLDELHLKVLAASSESASERASAVKVLALLQGKRHWVLVVLLLCNVIVNESLPIFLDSAIGGGLAAVVISTVAIVIFGEVIPQALSVRYGLAIGATCAPAVRALMILFAPIAYPTAALLDSLLGAGEGTIYNKAELRALLAIHAPPSPSSSSELLAYGNKESSGSVHEVHGSCPSLNSEELVVLSGVLGLGDSLVTDIMTPIEAVMTLDMDDVLNCALLNRIVASGSTHIPVKESTSKTDFGGLLTVQSLAICALSQPRTLRDMLDTDQCRLSLFPEVFPETDLLAAFRAFRVGRIPMLLVTTGFPGGALGVVTMEDVMNRILPTNVFDSPTAPCLFLHAGPLTSTSTLASRAVSCLRTAGRDLGHASLASLRGTFSSTRGRSRVRARAVPFAVGAERTPLLPSIARLGGDGERDEEDIEDVGLVVCPRGRKGHMREPQDGPIYGTITVM